MSQFFPQLFILFLFLIPILQIFCLEYEQKPAWDCTLTWSCTSGQNVNESTSTAILSQGNNITQFHLCGVLQIQPVLRIYCFCINNQINIMLNVMLFVHPIFIRYTDFFIKPLTCVISKQFFRCLMIARQGSNIIRWWRWSQVLYTTNVTYLISSMVTLMFLTVSKDHFTRNARNAHMLGL